ncbi:vesicular glutamate transporter 1-like [Branchiostoma floridae x Branchiostoma belcheri]
MGAWAARIENNQRTPFVLTGQYIGMFLGTCTTGVITEKLGWAASFYIFGMVGIAWGVIADVSIRDFSLERPPMEPEDDIFLHGDRYQDGDSVNERTKLPMQTAVHRPPIPWLPMLTSPAVHVIVVCQVFLQCGTLLMTTYAPLYYAHSFHSDVKTVGTSAGVPVLIVAVCLSVASILADSRYGRSTMSTERLRKTVNTVGFFGLAACYISLAVSTGFARSLTSFCLSAVFVATAMGGGFLVNLLDIAPIFAGEIKGISTTVSHLAGSIFLVAVGLLTKYKTRNEWSIVFTVTACALIVAAILFIIFGSGNEQSWAREEPKEKRLTCTAPAVPDITSVFTKTILPVQYPLEEDYSRNSDEEEDYFEEEDTAMAHNLVDGKYSKSY